MKIVLVDDDPAVRDLVSLQLELEGHEVAAASDGASGLALVRQQRPDLVLLDVMMPELSGWEVLELLREDPGDPQVPVVLLTARDMPHDRQRAYEIGASAVLSKPHDGTVLVETVHALHTTRAARQAN
jgi:CheY-like chemotaxis protein